MSRVNTATPQNAYEADQQHNALLISLVLGVISIIMAIASYISRPAGSDDVLAIIATSLLGMVSFLCAALVRQNRHPLAMKILIGAITVALASFVSQTEGLGILLGMLTLILPNAIAGQTLPGKTTRRLSPIIGLMALVLIVADSYWPVPRPMVPPMLTTISYLASALVIVVFGLNILRQFRRYSLTTKLLATTIAVAMAAIVTVAVVVQRATRDSIVMEVGQNTKSLSQNQALSIGELLAQHIGSISALALNDGIQLGAATQSALYPEEETAVTTLIAEREAQWRSGTFNSELINADVAASLAQFTVSFPEYTQLMVVDNHGSLVNALRPTDRYNYSDTEWWERAYQIGFGATYVGEPYFDTRTNSFTAEIAVPIRSSSSEFTASRISGVVYATFKIDNLLASLAQTAAQTDGQVELHFPNNTKLEIRADGQPAIYELSPEEAARIAQLRETGSAFFMGTMGEESGFQSLTAVYSTSANPTIENLDWSVLTSRSEASALRALSIQQRVNVLIGAVVLLAAGFAAGFVGNRLTRPIKELTETAVRVTKGDLNARAAVDTEDEIGVLAQSFNTMTNQLQETLFNLEARVSERTHMLQISAAISRNLSTLMDPDKITQAVVNQVQQAFNYYHVHIYLWNEDKSRLVMTQGTGEAGAQMLAASHALLSDQGLVGQAARTNSPVLVPDVKQNPAWLPNKLLPKTASEIAVPIAIGDSVLGVLDVQHHVKDGLQQPDVDLLITIADQVAIALQNARNFARTQLQAFQEARLNEISRKIQSTHDIESAMQIAVRELGRALDAKQAVVQLQAGVDGRNGHEEG